MKFNKVEVNTVTSMVEIWNYTVEGDNVKASKKVMDAPLAPWADKNAVAEMLMTLALVDNLW